MEQPTHTSGDEISIKAIIIGIRYIIKLLLKKWKVILLVVLLSASIGFIYSTFQETTYVAETSFILERGNNSLNNASYRNMAISLGVSNIFNLCKRKEKHIV